MSTTVVQQHTPPPATPFIKRQLSWYAVQIFSRSEKKVVTHLRGGGVDVFLPLVKEVHHWSDRRKIVHRALLPGYAFIRAELDSEVRLQVLQTPGVYSFVLFGGAVPAVPDDQIDKLRRLAEHNIQCAQAPYLKVGQRVRVRGGCLDGLEGILVAKHGENTLAVSIDAVQRSISIPISEYGLELIETSRR